jgi:hypothetical protein
VSPESVVSHELGCHLIGEYRSESSLDVDRSQLALLEIRIGRQFPCLSGEIGLLGVSLRAHGDKLAGCHRERPGRQASTPGKHDGVAGRLGSRDTDNEAAGRDETVVRAENCGSQPADRAGSVFFRVLHDQS